MNNFPGNLSRSSLGAFKTRSSELLYSKSIEKNKTSFGFSLGVFLIFLAVAIGIGTRLIAVFQYVTFDIGPDPDQIRDAFVVMDMWHGKLPTLGPQVSTIGSHHILPLYYYLFFPFTFLGAEPVFLALPNALFSCLSIPLFIYLLYRLLEGVSRSTRIFLSGLGGLWYSVLFDDIFISNFQWNPSSIPFFLMVLTLLYCFQMQGNFSFIGQLLLWAAYGVVFAIAISLHSSTLFIMPAVFSITSVTFIYVRVVKQRKSLWFILLPVVSLLSSLVTLLPYWIGEIGREFQNTKSILRTIVQSSTDSNGNLLINLHAKFSNLLLSSLTLIQQTYFWNSSLLYGSISILFLSIVAWWGVIKFRGNQPIWLMWSSTWLLFLLAASNINPIETPAYYKLLIVFAPIVLTVSLLAYVEGSPRKKQVCFVVMGAFVSLSLISNLSYDYRFMLSKYGPNRLMNTNDIAQILERLPPKSTICDPRISRKRETLNQYNYIDTYITHREVSVVSDCEAGNFVIHPKRNMLIDGDFLNTSDYKKPYFFKASPSSVLNLFPTFEIADSEAITRPSELVQEIETAYVYRLVDEAT